MPPPTLQQLHEDFMADCRYSARLSSATLQNYQATFELLIKVMPSVGLESLTSETLTSFFRELETRQRMVGHGRVKEGVKASTIATYRAKLNPFFKWLKHKRHIAASPFDNMPHPKVVYEDPKYLHQGEIKKILTAVGFSIHWSTLFVRKRNLAIIVLLLYTGLRKSELVNIELHDLDLARCELRVNAATSKSKCHKTLPINPEVHRRLADYLEERRKLRSSVPHLFVSETGSAPFTENGLKRMIGRVSKESGVRFHVHQLRHTFAVNLINSGSDISVVQKLLGHKGLNSTLTYLRCIPSKTLHRSVATLSLDTLV